MMVQAHLMLLMRLIRPQIPEMFGSPEMSVLAQ
jgi:hypothetical protein